MKRTNVVIREDLIEQAIRLTGERKFPIDKASINPRYAPLPEKNETAGKLTTETRRTRRGFFFKFLWTGLNYVVVRATRPQSAAPA